MKLSLIYSQSESHWLSCQFITRNLVTSYAQFLPISNPKKSQVVNFHKDLDFYEIKKIADEIFSFQPDTIIFLDHSPHPSRLLNLLYSNYKEMKKKLPSIIFHVYGDFTLLGKEWLESQSTLKKFKITWACASEGQAKLLDNFIKKPENSISLIPFPVDDSTFFFNKSLRNKTRKDLKIKEKEIVFVYSGRLSYQKRIAALLHSFNSLAKSSPNVKLILVGPFDNLGNHYTREYFEDGEFAQKIMKYFALLDPEIQKKINYLGCVENSTLNKIYNASDVFVSLSTHNDEDYGMAPAEALCTGLPAILTNWGGYYSFQKEDNNVHLVPVAINQSLLKINIENKSFLEKADILISNINELQKNRGQQAVKNSNELSTSYVSNLLQKNVNSPSKVFSGFTTNMNHISDIFVGNSPFTTQSIVYSELYCKLYENYISKKL